MTHGPPRGVLDRTKLGDERGCVWLRNAVERVRPRVHAFGHIHEGRGCARVRWRGWPGWGGRVEVLEEDVGVGVGGGNVVSVLDLTEENGRGLRWGRETVFVNAAVRDERSRIANKPWVVKVDLSVVEE